MSRHTTLDALIGETLIGIDGMEAGSEQITLRTKSGRSFRFWHDQDCCESVSVEDVVGHVADLLHAPLLVAREDTNATAPAPQATESYTWTFYNFATVRGHVTVRWLGESNGYYGESVDFAEVTDA